MNSIAEMRAGVFFEGPDAGLKLSRFWLLLCLAATIASAGIVGDSTATVIGAMIVAPLMIPIQGVVLATVTADRRNLLYSWALVAAGATTAVVIGYLVGLLVPAPVVAATNGQVTARVAPNLIDLLAALATGAVGAVALVRKDISNALTGVAIAISLVPPLCVVGLTLESGAWSESLAALLVFAANVAAILATGVIILSAYRIGGVARGTIAPDEPVATGGWGRRNRAVITILVTLAIIGLPLAFSSVRLTNQELLENAVRSAVEPWAEQNGWRMGAVQVEGTDATVSLTGAPPLPDTAALVSALKAQGIDPSHVTVQFIPAYEVHLNS